MIQTYLAVLAAIFMRPAAGDWRDLGATGDQIVTWDAASVARDGDLVDVRLRLDRDPSA